MLKLVSSNNFTLTVNSPKLWQAKTHFLSHFEGKKEKKYMARLGFEPMNSRSSLLHWSLVRKLANLFMWWDKKWFLACQSFGECTARVKLELTDFNVSTNHKTALKKC